MSCSDVNSGKASKMSTPQSNEFLKQLLSAGADIALEIPPDIAQGWIENPKAFRKVIREALIPQESNDFSELLFGWEKFYRDVFEVEVDLSGLSVPSHQKGFDRLIVVAQGITSKRIYDKCAELFPCRKWTDKSLDEVVESERAARDGAYAVWFRDRIEADEELKNISANELKKQNISGITIEERLLMELKYFKETGKHLDVKSVTLCSGSRYSDGDVPLVGWDYDELLVYRYVPGISHGDLRSRQAVSS